MIYIIGIGSNMSSKFGGPIKTLKFAIKQLNQNNINVIKKSFLYSSQPQGFNSAANIFFNGALMVNTSLQPGLLLLILKNIEKSLGRYMYKKNSSRSCDLDILLMRPDKIPSIQKNNTKCILPHPRMHNRGFVLRPMMDICSNWVHPELNKRICDIYKANHSAEKLYKIPKKL